MTDTSTAAVERLIHDVENADHEIDLARVLTIKDGRYFSDDIIKMISALAAERDALLAERHSPVPGKLGQMISKEKMSEILVDTQIELAMCKAERDALRSQLAAMAAAVSPGFVRADPARPVALKLDSRKPL